MGAGLGWVWVSFKFWYGLRLVYYNGCRVRYEVYLSLGDIVSTHSIDICNSLCFASFSAFCLACTPLFEDTNCTVGASCISFYPLAGLWASVG